MILKWQMREYLIVKYLVCFSCMLRCFVDVIGQAFRINEMTFQRLIMKSVPRGTRKINSSTSQIPHYYYNRVLDLNTTELTWLYSPSIIRFREIITKDKSCLRSCSIFGVYIFWSKNLVLGKEMLHYWITSILFGLGFISIAANCNLRSDRFDRQDRDYRPLQVSSLSLSKCQFSFF